MCTTESSNRCTSPATYTVAGLIALQSLIFLIFAVMAGWQQVNCIRFCCKLMKL